MEPREEFSDILNRAVLLRWQFHPEGHGSAVCLYRLLYVGQANGRDVLMGEPACDADFAGRRCALSSRGDPHDHSLTRQPPYLVLGQAERLRSVGVQSHR